MKVEYLVKIGGREVVVSQNCDTDCDMFKFLYHMGELFDNCTCERNGQSSDKVKINVRSDSDGNSYYEMLCFDPDQPECHYAKRKFGVNKEGGGLFPKNKDAEGNWKPWTKYNKEAEKEE